MYPSTVGAFTKSIYPTGFAEKYYFNAYYRQWTASQRQHICETIHCIPVSDISELGKIPE